MRQAKNARLGGGGAAILTNPTRQARTRTSKGFYFVYILVSWNGIAAGHVMNPIHIVSYGIL